MRKNYFILIVLLLGITISGIAQENNGYMTLIASGQSGAVPDGSLTNPGDQAFASPLNDSFAATGNSTTNLSGSGSLTTSGRGSFTTPVERSATVYRDGTIYVGSYDTYLELKRGVDENVIEPEDWKANTRIGLSNEEVARMIIINPSPVVDRFHLKVPAEVGEVKQAGFYNMDGRRVRSFGAHIGGGKDRDLEMDATDLIPGLYFLRIENEAGIISKSFEVLDI